MFSKTIQICKVMIKLTLCWADLGKEKRKWKRSGGIDCISCIDFFLKCLKQIRQNIKI